MIEQRCRWHLAVIAVSWLVAAQAQADGASHILFSGVERQLIVSYYEAQRSVLRYLPDDSEPALKRGERLAESRSKRRLPHALEERLPVLPVGYERAVVDGRVVLLDASTRTVRDVLPDIVVARE